MKTFLETALVSTIGAFVTVFILLVCGVRSPLTLGIGVAAVVFFVVIFFRGDDEEGG